MLNLRSTLVVFLLAIVSVTAAIWTERVRPAAGAGAYANAEQPLFDGGRPPGGDIERIGLQRDDDPPRVYELDEGRWWQVRPFRFPMDGFSIEELLREAGALQIVGRLDGDLDAATLGLDPPAAVLSLEGGSGTTMLRLGRRSFAGRAYLRVDERDEILVVRQALHDRVLGMDEKEWRDRRLFPEAGIDADRIEITTSAQSLVFERDRRQWKVRSPFASRLEDLVRDDLLETLGKVRSAGFIADEPDELAAFGLVDPVGRVVVTWSQAVPRDGVTIQEARTRALVVGARIGVGSLDRFGLVEGFPVVVRLTESLLAALFRPAESFAPQTASGVQPADVKSIRVQGPDGEFRLERDLERWLLEGEPPREVDGAKVGELLASLTEARATAVELRAYPRELNVATITLFGYAGRPLDTVRVAREQATDGAPGRWILENGDGILRYFPAAAELRLGRGDF